MNECAFLYSLSLVHITMILYGLKWISSSDVDSFDTLDEPEMHLVSLICGDIADLEI